MIVKNAESDRKASYCDLFWIFMLGSVLGFVLEGIWFAMRKGYWENHTATLWGPFCIIYGLGAVVLYVCANVMKGSSVFKLFLVSSLAGTSAELATALFQEVSFGTYSWNYSGHLFNFNGKISLQMSIMWGILGTVFIKLVVPYLDRALEITHGGGWDLAVVLLSVFMAVNLSVTCAALVRWKHRTEGKVAENRVERFMDKKWDDEYLKKTFPNMKRK